MSKEIKISISGETNDLIESVASSLGIKKTEYVKSLVIENLKEIRLDKKEKVNRK